MNELTIKQDYSQDQKELIKRTVAPGTSDDELALFLHQCQRTGLDPLSNQIHCIKRKSKDKNGNWTEKATIQTGIDGFRLIADRTGRYAPGEIEYRYDKEGKLLSALAIVMKEAGGKWHEVKAEAFYTEYVQTYTDRSSGKAEPTGLWKKMPRLMLGKCAEALALRKAFPAELSGLYTDDEMRQADGGDRPDYKTPPEEPETKLINNAPAGGPNQIKRQIMTLLIKTGVPEIEIKDVGTWLIEWKNGDLDAALATLAGWDAQGMRFDIKTRVWKPVETAEVVNG